MTTPKPSPPRGLPIPTSLDRMRLLKETLLAQLGGVDRVRTFNKGQTILHEGDDLEGTSAFLVISGKLIERMTRYVKGHGQKAISLCEVTPGAIANVQTLVPQYAQQSAVFTVEAVERTEVIALNPLDIRQLEQFGVVLNGMMRKSMQNLDELSALREVEADLEDAQFGLQISEGDLARERDHAEALELVLKECESKLERAEERASALKEKLKAEHAIAAAARDAMAVAVDELGSEKIRMTNFGLGMELYLDRIREQCRRRGLPPEILNFTEAESMLLVGEVPRNLEELRSIVRQSRQIDFGDDLNELLVAYVGDESPTDIFAAVDELPGFVDPEDIEMIDDGQTNGVAIDANLQAAEEIMPADRRAPMATIDYEERPDEGAPQRLGIIVPTATAVDPNENLGRRTSAYGIPVKDLLAAEERRERLTQTLHGIPARPDLFNGGSRVPRPTPKK